jgi:hypothetical protein
MIERAVVTCMVVVVVLSMLRAVLPRVTPSLVALGVLVLLGRAVWFYTR